MGKTKKGHNWKARLQPRTEIDHSAELKIKDKVQIEGLQEEKYDDTNALVLPSSKRNTKVVLPHEQHARKLSKKQRKHLEKIVEQKQKKAKRAELLQALSQVQASKEEQALLTSTTEVYSGKYKRKFQFEQTPTGHVKINAISGSNKKRQRKDDAPPNKCVVISDSSSSDSDLSSGEETASETEDDEEEEDLQSGSFAGGQSSDSFCNTDKPSQDSGMEDSREEFPSSDSSKNPVQIKPKDIVKVTGEMAKTTDMTERKAAVYIPVKRLPEVQEARLKLPILGEEQQIMEAINEHPIVILCGETGSGKTTQVPQFLYEAAFAHGGGIIGVTEPRRVAAISMSQRVAMEMNLSTSEVSYQIRYEGNVTPNTKIKFMTDGVLLKEVQQDFLLTKYSVIIIDEAHERSMYTDIMIGLLSRIVPLRAKKGNSLKLIIMSATLRVEDFTENSRLFKVTPPVIQVDSRQFPVTIHFNKRTPVDNYLGEAFRKISKIHCQLPEGGILVFVTGQQEVHTLCARLKHAFPMTPDSKGKSEKRGGKTKGKSSKFEKDAEPTLPKIRLEDYSVLPLDEEAELHAVHDLETEGHLSDEDNFEGDNELDNGSNHDSSHSNQPLYVLPLYSLLSTDRQSKVFQPPPEGCRLCVVATNVAETSITIPNIKYVVDTGKVKTKFYDKVTGVSAFKVTWTSKAGANQRAGRAGRTGPGHCYRLYSSAVFNDEFEQHSAPEITRRPVEELVLQMKDMSIDKVVNFPFPTPPDEEALKAAEQLLVSLGALERPQTPARFKDMKRNEKCPSSKITSLGRAMACFPVSPRYGKMLSLGHQHDLLPYVVAIVAALSVQELFVESYRPSDEREDHKNQRLRLLKLRKTWAGTGHSLLLGDLMVLLKAVGAAEFSGVTQQFCDRHGIRYKAMAEIRKLRMQLTNAVNSVISGANLVLDPKMAPPNDLQAKLLRQIVLAGMGDHVARKMADPVPGSEDAKKMKNAYQCSALAEPVFIHPNSVLYKQDVPYVVYQQIDETSKLYMKGVSSFEVDWLPVFVSNRCTFSKPQEDPPPRYDEDTGHVVCHMTSTFGPHCWPVPAAEIEFPAGLDRFKWFARFLLEGKVFPKLRNYSSTLLTAPVTMVKSWAKLQPRTETLLKALVAEGADCKESLEKTWKKNPQYLLAAYSEWIPQAQHLQLSQNWPPL